MATEEKQMNCGSCAHWLRNTERTDFSSAVSFHDDEPWNLDEEETSRSAIDEKKFGLCSKITEGWDLSVKDPTPLAVTRDGSEYLASLYTQGEFGCVLWEAE
jgi:hypothetical protein